MKYKDKKASRFYGVTIWVRKLVASEKIWYKARIFVDGNLVRLGNYEYEEFAAYAFNLGFKYYSKGDFIIENNVNYLSKEDKEFIENKIKKYLL